MDERVDKKIWRRDITGRPLPAAMKKIAHQHRAIADIAGPQNQDGVAGDRFVTDESDGCTSIAERRDLSRFRRQVFTTLAHGGDHRL